MTTKRGFAASDLWQLRTVSAPDLSSDGTRVAFTVTTPDPGTDTNLTSVWVAPTDGSGPARRFSSGDHDSLPKWSPDGSALAFLSDRGSEAQIVVAPLSGGEAVPLTAAPYGVTGFSWSPDGTRIAYVTRTGEWTKPEDRSALERSAPTVVTDLYHRYDNIGYFDARRRHIFVVDVAGGRDAPGEAVQVTDGDWDDSEPVWSPDGSLLAFASDRSATRHAVAQQDLWTTAPVAGATPTRLTGGIGTAVGPRFSPDGRLVSYVGHRHGPGDSSKNNHLMVVPADASGEPRSLSAVLDRSVWGLLPAAGASHVWRSDGSVLFLAGEAGTQGVYAADPAGAQVVPVAGGDRQVMAIAGAEGVIAFVAQWPSFPVELFCAKPDGSDERAVTALNAGWADEVSWAPVERVRSRSADGLEIDSYVLYPPGFVKGEPAPTVLEIHGGPHSWHPQGSMLGLYQCLAAAGYVVVLPNPRGSQGYGERFAGSCVADWGGADFGDLMSALDHLVAEGIADPARLYVAGYSYGGFMTAWTVGHTDRFRAACVSAPVSNLVSMFGTTDIPYFNEHESGGSPWEVPDYYREHSPVTYLPRVTTPVLVLHWDGDLRCPVGQGEEVFQGLVKLGKEAVMVRYPGGYHIRRTPSQLIDWTQRHLEWFAAH